MVGRHHRAHRIAPQVLELEPRCVEWPVDRRGVDLAAAEPAGRIDQVSEVDPQGHVRAQLAEPAERLAHLCVGHRRDEADRQRALLAGGVARARHRLVRGGEQRPRGLEQRRSRGRELDPAGCAHDEHGAHALLELADRAAECLLRDVEALAGAGEVELLGNGHEVAQLPQLDAHRGSLSRDCAHKHPLWGETSRRAGFSCRGAPYRRWGHAPPIRDRRRITSMHRGRLRRG